MWKNELVDVIGLFIGLPLGVYLIVVFVL